MRLLLVDEAIAIGGVERVWLALMPELAQRCEQLVWMLPQYRLDTMKNAMPNGAKVHFESFFWPEQSVGKVVNAVGRRLAKMLGNPAACQRLEQWLENMRLRSVARAHSITHILYPALFSQPFPNVRQPVWAVVHDVNYHPSWHRACLKNLEVWMGSAKGLITISQFTKEEALRRFPHSPGSLTVIPNASEWRVPNSQNEAPGGTPRLYYPASLNPHKGHSVLLKAVRLLHGQGCDVRLRLTGGATKDLLAYTPLALPELEEARSVLAGGSAEFHRLVEVLGMVSKEEVEMCFAEADLVVLPSRYEGFGLPLAEAVARGKRVLCSDIPAFREQIRLYGFDRAVTFVVSETAVAWADAIRQALSDYRQAPYSSGELRNLFARWTWSDVAWHYAETLAAA